MKLVVLTEQYVLDGFPTDETFYGLGYGIQEAIMVLDMDLKTPYMILDMVCEIQQKC